MKTFSMTPSPTEKKDIISCPFCHSDDYKPHWDCTTFSFVRCKQCGLIYQNPQPVFKEIADRYDKEYFSYEIENQDIFYNLMKKSLEDVCFSEIERNLPSSRSFLDVGCATGVLLEHLKENWKVTGVELCDPAAEYGRTQRKVDIKTGTLENIQFPSNSFDVVHCSHLIEHLNNPKKYISEVYRILKPGGVLLVSTPNTSGLQARIFKEKWRSAIADHLCLFSMKNLKLLLKQTNFKIVSTKTWGGLGLGSGSQWLKPLLDKSAKKLGFGDVMIIRAEKPLS